MSDSLQNLQEIIQSQFQQKDFDIVGIVPIPAHSDRMVRLRTLQEIIEDFEESNHSGAIEYLLQVKPKQQQPVVEQRSNLPLSDDSPENIYLSNGQLNIQYLLKNAELLYNAKEYLLAIAIYKTILTSGECTNVVHNRLGKCFEAEGKTEEALIHYEESIAYHPCLDSYKSLSRLLIRLKKDLLAAEVLSRALNLKDLSPKIRFELYKASGNCWVRAQKHEQAEKSFKKALEINPSADEIRSNLGALYLQSNKIQESKRHFQDAIASNPRNHHALSGLGYCCVAEADPKSGYNYLVQALGIELNNPTAILLLVQCAYSIKSYATTAKFLQEYVQIAPVHSKLLFSLAGLQYHLGRITDAKATTLKILDLQSEHSEAKELLTLIERYTGPST